MSVNIKSWMATAETTFHMYLLIWIDYTPSIEDKKDYYQMFSCEVKQSHNLIIYTVKPVLRGHLNIQEKSVPTWQVFHQHRFFNMGI